MLDPSNHRLTIAINRSKYTIIRRIEIVESIHRLLQSYFILSFLFNKICDRVLSQGFFIVRLK